MKFITLIFLLLSLSGCINNVYAPLPDFTNAPKPPIDIEAATIYVMRFGPYEVRSSNSIKVNGEELVTLAPGYYTWFQLLPGKYEVSETPLGQSKTSEQNSSSIQIQVEKNKTYFFGFSESSKSNDSNMQIMIVGNIPIPIVTTSHSGKSKRNWVSGSEKEGKEALMYMGYAPSKSN